MKSHSLYECVYYSLSKSYIKQAIDNNGLVLQLTAKGLFIVFFKDILPPENVC